MSALRPDARVIRRNLLPSVLIVAATPVVAVILAGEAMSVLVATVVVALLVAMAVVATWARTPPSVAVDRDRLTVSRRRRAAHTVDRADVGAVWIDVERLALVGGDALRVASPGDVPADPAQPIVPWRGYRVASVGWYDHVQLRDVFVKEGWPVRVGVTPSELRRSRRDAARGRRRD